MYQHDVPFGVKEYVDAKLRRHIDEHKGHSKQGDDSTAGKQDAAEGSGQNAAVDSGNDTGKGATAGKPEPKPAASKSEGERPRSGTDADAMKPDLPYEPSTDEISRYVGNIRNSQNMDFEYKTMPVASIKPSQSGEDYINDSSRETARIHKQYKTGDDIGYRGDFMPIVVDEDNNIIDGNHRHAAHTMNGWKNMRVLVAKKGGAGKVKGVPMQKTVLDVSHIRKAGVKALCLLRKSQQVSGYTTSTGRRVDGYCRHCGDGAIFDYKTDHHDDGIKHSYKQCRNCGDKIPVVKRMTKQKKEREALQQGYADLVKELLAGKDLTKALCLLRHSKSKA